LYRVHVPAACEGLHGRIGVFTLFVFPKRIQSDNGTAFVNDMMKTFTKELGNEQRTATAYHPRGNGAAEIRVKCAKLLLTHGKLLDEPAICLPDRIIGIRVHVCAAAMDSRITVKNQMDGR
jgi:hypothetical protein